MWYQDLAAKVERGQCQLRLCKKSASDTTEERQRRETWRTWAVRRFTATQRFVAFVDSWRRKIQVFSTHFSDQYKVTESLVRGKAHKQIHAQPLDPHRLIPGSPADRQLANLSCHLLCSTPMNNSSRFIATTVQPPDALAMLKPGQSVLRFHTALTPKVKLCIQPKT